MGWQMFPPPEKPDPSARFEITYVPFHPCVRAEQRRSQTTRVRGTEAKAVTTKAIRDSGGQVLKVRKRGLFG